MKNIKRFLTLNLIAGCFAASFSQTDLTIENAASGLQLMVINKDYPLLKILLPGQSKDERGIEVEFPEHVTGLNEQTKSVEHLYLVTRGTQNNRTLPIWRREGNTLLYETSFNGDINMIAKVELTSKGVYYTYTLTNHSSISYQNLQAVTCVKLYSAFSDTQLERTYVHHTDGFDLLASETPKRLTMTLQQWLPCRYLASYTWPVSKNRVEKDEDSITRYNKSRQVDMPLMATLSHDKQWIAATYTSTTGNIWINPERSCQHVDPATNLNPNETKTLMLTTLVIKSSLSDLLRYVKK